MTHVWLLIKPCLPVVYHTTPPYSTTSKHSRIPSQADVQAHPGLCSHIMLSFILIYIRTRLQLSTKILKCQQMIT